MRCQGLPRWFRDHSSLAECRGTGLSSLPHLSLSGVTVLAINVVCCSPCLFLFVFLDPCISNVAVSMCKSQLGQYAYEYDDFLDSSFPIRNGTVSIDDFDFCRQCHKEDIRGGYTPTVPRRGLCLEHRPRGLRRRGRAVTAADPAHRPLPRNPAARSSLVDYRQM